jgi:hypothetical protein
MKIFICLLIISVSVSISFADDDVITATAPSDDVLRDLCDVTNEITTLSWLDSSATTAFCWYEFHPKKDITVGELARAISCEMEANSYEYRVGSMAQFNGLKRYAYDCVDNLDDGSKRHFESICR